MVKRLWEIKHPYYMSDGNYYNNGCHTTYETWADFIDEWQSSDIDYNWFVRWDWREGDDWDLEPYDGDDTRRHARLMLQRIGQRKALLDSHEVHVCRADEPEIIKFLTPYWQYMQAMWEPFSTPAPSDQGAHP